MKRYKQLITAGVSLCIVGILVGCGTSSENEAPFKTTSTTNTTTGANNALTSTPAPTQSINNNSISTKSNSTPTNSVSTRNATSNATSNISQKPITPSATNFNIIGVQSPNKTSIQGMAYTPPKLVHGVLEPIVISIDFTNIQTPIYVDFSQFVPSNLSSSTTVGGIEYFKYNGKIYKTSKAVNGTFPVMNTIVLSNPSSVTLIGTVGTPTPTGSKIELSYGNMVIGSYDVTNLQSYNLS